MCSIPFCQTYLFARHTLLIFAGMKKIALIVAGGSGERMKSSIPKQFLLLARQPILMHTIEKFHAYDPQMEIRLVLPSSQLDTWRDLCETHRFSIRVQTFAGGTTRFQSVKNGLQNIPQNALVAVHDGVRPLVSIATISKCFEEASQYGAAIPVVELNESIRRLTPGGSQAEDRTLFRLVQTPQVFRSNLLLNAYNAPYRETYTDDASVVEQSGHPIQLVEGNPENIKITTSMDLSIAQSLL